MAHRGTIADGFLVGINIDYAIKVLAALEGDEIRCQFNDADSAIGLRGEDDLNQTTLIMPIRLSKDR